MAARKANRDPFTVYQIRHSFATWLRHAALLHKSSVRLRGTQTRLEG